MVEMLANKHPGNEAEVETNVHDKETDMVREIY